MDTESWIKAIFVFGFLLQDLVLGENLPVLIEAPRPIALREGSQNVVMSCKFSRAPKKCQWTRDGVAIDFELYDNDFQLLSQKGSSDCSFTIRELDITKTDGNWSCHFPDISRPGAILVSSPPVLVIALVGPDEPQLYHGDQLVTSFPDLTFTPDNKDRLGELRCVSARGHPASRIEWKIEGETKQGEDQYIPDRDKPALETVISRLPLTLPMEGKQIHCIVHHPSYGDLTKDRYAIMHVPYATSFVEVKSERDVKLPEHEPKVLTCIADGSPPPRYRWEKLKDPMDTRGQVVFDKQNLSFAGVPEEAGVYVCIAQQNNSEEIYSESSKVTVSIVKAEAANMMAIIGILLGLLLAIIIISAILYFAYVKQMLCFADSGKDDEDEEDVEAQKEESKQNGDTALPPDAQYDSNKEKSDNNKNGQTEDKTKEVVYAQLDLNQTNGQNKRPPVKPSGNGDPKTEYAQIQFKKENQV